MRLLIGIRTISNNQHQQCRYGRILISSLESRSEMPKCGGSDDDRWTQSYWILCSWLEIRFVRCVPSVPIPISGRVPLTGAILGWRRRR